MNKELLEKIAHLETELEEVKEMAEEMKKRADGGLFKLENGQTYWFISGAGGIISKYWNNDSIDNDCYSIGNCFPTEQSAEDTVRVLKLIQKARESQDGFVPDWEDMTQYKYYISFNYSEIWVAGHPLINIAPMFGYWKNKSECERFIGEYYDEIIWFFTEYRR